MRDTSSKGENKSLDSTKADEENFSSENQSKYSNTVRHVNSESAVLLLSSSNSDAQIVSDIPDSPVDIQNKFIV